MSGARAPLPPLSGTITALEWVIVLCLWLLLALLSAGPIAADFQRQGITVDPAHLRLAQSLDWAIWALLLPFITRTLDRVPLTGRRWLLHLAGWGLAGLAFGAIHALLSLPLIHLVAALLEVPATTLSAVGLSWPALMRDDTSNFTLAIIAYVSLQFVHRNRRERTQAAEVERLLREARLHALGLELQPHFLFNTLNAIAGLIRADPRRAEELLIQLGDLLRLTLHADPSGMLPLGEELRRLELYLALQRARHGARLTTQVLAPDELQRLLVPAMLLQPLVENAISHGIGGRPGPGTVTVQATREGDLLRLSVQDDGVGVPAGGPSREGIGLSNSRARLEVLFPGRGRLQVEPAPGCGTRVTARFPAIEAAPTDLTQEAPA